MEDCEDGGKCEGGQGGVTWCNGGEREEREKGVVLLLVVE